MDRSAPSSLAALARGRTPEDKDLLWWALPDDSSLAGIAFGVAFAVVIGVVVVIVVPLVLFVAELLLVLVAVLLLRGTWIVEARTAGPSATQKAWKVRGWLRGKRAVEEVASELRAGVEAAPAEGEPV